MPLFNPVTVGTIDSQTPSANGAVAIGSSLVFQTASSSNPGLVKVGNLTSSPTTNLVVTGGTGAVIGTGALLTLTGASLIEATSSVLTIVGATNAVLGTGVTIQVKQSSTSVSGYLSNTDWNTFNNKQPAGSYITSLTGAITASGPGASAVSITAQTGTGTTFVMQTAPTMTNPVVGTQTQGDASTKAASTAYVDTAVANAVAGINPAVAVDAATTQASDTSGLAYNNGVSGVGAFFTGAVNTALTIDGYTFTALGQRLLVKNDTQSPSGAFNGIYYVTQIQTAILPIVLTRALDYNTPAQMNETGAIPVINGTVNITTTWLQTSLIVTVGTTPLVFVRFTRNPADYLLVANNLSDVGTKATAFNNVSPVTSTGDLIIGNGSNSNTRLAKGTQYQTLQTGASTLGYDALHLDQAAAITGTLPVGNGGTGLASGTSGGVLAFTASGTLASSGALTANQLVIGGGAGVAPSVLAAGTNGNILQMGASNPGYATPSSVGACMVLIATGTASNSATIDFTSISNSTYDSYMIIADNIIPATNTVSLLLRFSVGGTFKSGASAYSYRAVRYNDTGVASSGLNTNSSILVSSDADAIVNNGTYGAMSFKMTIFNCASLVNKHAIWEASYQGSVWMGITGCGIYFTSTEAIDGFRFLCSSGNITSGTFKLYGIRSS